MAWAYLLLSIDFSQKELLLKVLWEYVLQPSRVRDGKTFFFTVKSREVHRYASPQPPGFKKSKSVASGAF